MRTIGLYGNSLGVAGIAASLEGQPGLRVVPAEQLGATRPDVVLFDAPGCVPDSSLIALWKAQLGLLFIGVDLANNRALILHGRSSRMLTIDDLIDEIETHAAVYDIGQ